MEMEIKFDDLLGKVITKIKQSKDYTKLIFEVIDGSKYLMYHEQDCCEDVYIDDVVGDFNDIVGYKVLRAYETSNHMYSEVWDESHTWTFYSLSTIKGSVTIKWIGSSNGFYSEAVDFIKFN